MTLFIALQNDTHTVLAVDRRITRTDTGEILSDNKGKCGAVVMRDAKFAYAYTGLATWKTWDSSRWVRTLICRAAPPDYLCKPMIERFRSLLSLELATNPQLLRLSEADRRIHVGFFGFVVHQPSGVPQPFRAGATSVGIWDGYKFVPDGRFEFQRAPPGVSDLAIASIGGNWPQISESLAKEADALLARRPPEDALIGKALDMLQIAHERESADARATGRAAGNIGRRANYIALATGAEPRLGYDPGTLSDEIWMPDIITATSVNNCYWLQVDLKKVPRSGESVIGYVPRTRPNNPCPCGSGRPYRNCHQLKRRW